MTHSFFRTQKGFTLVEMLTVIGVSSMITLAIFQSIVSFYQYNGYTIAQAYQVEYARRGTEQLVRDLREMTYADNGAFPLVQRGDYSIGFYSDIDRDASVEYIEYQLATTTLQKRVYNALGTPASYSTTTPSETHILSEYVQNEIQGNPIFVYYDSNGQVATSSTNMSDIAYVQISVIVNIDILRDPDQYMLRTSASLRNLGN